MTLWRSDGDADHQSDRRTTGLVINLFGPGTISLNGKPLNLDNRDAKRVFFWLVLEAALKCEGGIVRKKDLENAFWFGDGKQNSLDQSLRVIRKTLGAERTRLKPLPDRQLSFDLNGLDVDLIRFVEALDRGDNASLAEARDLLKREILQGRSDPWLTRYREYCQSRYRHAYGSENESENTSALPSDLSSSSVPELIVTLIGRESDVNQIKVLLRQPGRLVTVKGFPGVGKTSLAKRVGKELLHASDSRDGIWFVDLSALTDSSQISTVVAKALARIMHETSKRSTLCRIYRRPKP